MIAFDRYYKSLAVTSAQLRYGKQGQEQEYRNNETLHTILCFVVVVVVDGGT